MVSEYLKANENVFTNNDLASMQIVFDTLKNHTFYEDHPEKLHELARSIFAAYKETSTEPDTLIRMLRCGS